MSVTISMLCIIITYRLCYFINNCFKTETIIKQYNITKNNILLFYLIKEPKICYDNITL